MTEVPAATAAATAGRPVPAPVLALAGGDALRPVWENAVGGLTFEVGAGERRLDPSQWHEEYQGLGVDAALDLPAEVPPVDELVVCHGDSCAPNTLIGANGRWTGHVDLGELGVADRWADLAVATWSTIWNYGPGWEARLLDAYGVAPDPDRTWYYRLLWELGP